MRHFKEYLDNKGKLQEKPIIDPKADTGPEPEKYPPTAANKGKNWENKAALSEKPQPYTPSTSPEKQPKYEKGLGDQGDSKLVYEPKTGTDTKTVSGWPKTKTEEFIDRTKNMSLSEFAAYVSNQNKSEPFDVSPIQAFKYVNKLISGNPTQMENFIREVKREGAFDKLVEEIFRHQETFVEMAFLMSNEQGSVTCKNIVNALREVTDAPASETEVTKKDLSDKPKNKRKTKSIDGEPMDMGTMGNSDVVATKGSIKPEHNLVNAMLGNKNIVEIITRKLTKEASR